MAFMCAARKVDWNKQPFRMSQKLISLTIEYQSNKQIDVILFESCRS